MRINRLALFLTGAILAAVLSFEPGRAAGDGLYKKASGIEAYLGVVPAEITKGHEPTAPQGPMHGGVPEGGSQYHLVAAVFESKTGQRITDATVTAQVSGLGKTGNKITLELMSIAGTQTYGGYILLAGPGSYTIVLTVRRSGHTADTVLRFPYEHRDS